MIKLENIMKDYISKEQVTHALRGINLTIEQGEFLGIVGTSGSGKTTLLNILGGMDTATSGRYLFEGCEIDVRNQKALHEFRKKSVGFVFQNFALMEKYTVYENVEMPLLARDVKARKGLVMEQLEKMKIADLKDKFPLQLSGGQQQRCAIARALVSEAKLLLADEPTGALDQNTSEEIMKCFEDINKSGTTIVLITHDMEIAKRCSRVIRVEDGMFVDSVND